MSIIPQIAIMLLGVTAIFLSQSASEKARRYACLFGLAGQPFWFWATIEARQWGIAFMCCLYTLAWLKGVRTHWFNNRPKEGNMSEQQVEAAIQAAGCIAPRLDPKHIDAMIIDVTYTVLPSGKSIVCEITLPNGFTVRGDSAVVSKENFREDIGREVAFKKARDQIWQLEGYLLQQRLHEQNLVVDSIGNAVAEGAFRVTTSTWLERLIAERDELATRINKLVKFIDSADYVKLEPADQKLLASQRNRMSEYELILNKRIERAHTIHVHGNEVVGLGTLDEVLGNQETKQ